MLAKQAGARRPGAAEASAALRASAFELSAQQPQYAQQQAPGWSGLAQQPQPVRPPARPRRQMGNARLWRADLRNAAPKPRPLPARA